METTTITKEEIKQFWREYTILMIKWNLVSITGVLSTVVIWNFILKNYLGYKGKMATCNDTEPTFIEGDFGANWWLEKKGLKPSIWSAILWWLRNHSWNYISRFNPVWKAGSVDKNIHGKDEFKTIKGTVKQGKNGRFTRAHKKKKVYGTSYIAYRIDGKVYCQYSHANKFFQIQAGAGGERYRFNIKFT
jgi:hypothetical protein